MAVVNGNQNNNIELNSESTNEQKEDSLGAEPKSARKRAFLLNGTSKGDGDIAPPSPPPTLPPSVSSSPSLSPSGSPPPPSGSDEEEEKKLELEEATHGKRGFKASSTESGSSSSATNSTESTTIVPDNEASKSSPDLTTRNPNGLHPDSYPPLPPIPTSEAALARPRPPAARRSKSTGILNYPAGHPRSRASSLPVGAQGEEPVQGRLHSASCSSSSLNVKFAPLPQLAPRKRKSNTPLGVAARGQMMRQRRARMMGENPDAHPQPNGNVVIGGRRVVGGGAMWTEDEMDAHANRIAAAEARHRAMNSNEYLDEDGEEMEDPFVALGRMVKGAWKKMSKGKKGAGKENEEVGAVTNTDSNAGPAQVQLHVGEQASGNSASLDSAHQSPTVTNRANDEKDTREVTGAAGHSEPLQ
ncbi:hypothetical protein WG66_014323 [Moniliophthora roreri]|uniref:Uncharacterized protein n=1 Tax=Moniliophthora roreri TaxID=221103 RepID=A0A0W0G1Z8_MONRR|nr:hypothetical protein WG66_014323 [Moniliophthora roreri]